MTSEQPGRLRRPRRLPPVAALLRDRERLAGASPPAAVDAPAPQTRWAVAVGPWYLLFEAALGCELLEPRRPALLPGAPVWLAGVVNLRGTLAPVFDPAALAGGEAGEARLLAVGEGEAAAVLRVHGMPFRQDPGELGAPQAPPAALPPLLAGAVQAAHHSGGRPWLDCDLPALFTVLGREAATA